jgi:prolyl-tRNA synthetase
MRLTELFGSTLRKAPTDAETASYQWLARGGYIRPAANGNFVTLPLAERSLNKLRARLRYEMEVRGGQEIGAHAEIGTLASGDVQSYRQFPKLLFSFNERAQKGRPRLGLFGAAHSPSLDIHVLAEAEKTQETFQKMLNKVLAEFFSKLTLNTPKTERGGYAFITAKGAVDYIRCPQCGYLEKQASAIQKKNALPTEEALPLEKVETPDAHTIEALANFLEIPKEKTAKAVFMMAQIGDAEKLVFAILRGDMDLNEAKLMAALGSTSLRPATDQEILDAKAVPGYASPVGIENMLIIVDDLIPASANLVAGANEAGNHLRNVNYGRDYEATIVTDIALTKMGDPCPKCETNLAQIKGVELVDTAPACQLDDATFTDESGKGQPVWAATWTLDLGRTLAAVAESHHDDYGVILPPAVTPYDIHLIWLPSKNIDTRGEAEDLYLNLTNTGFTVLFDDRDARAGEKFNDADLIGCPVRITVGEKALQDSSVEIKLRREKDKALVELDDIANYVLENLE